MLSLSRAVIISSLVVLLIYLAFNIRFKNFILITLASFIFIFTINSFFSKNSEIQYILEKKSEKNKSDDINEISSNRVIFWEFALNKFKKNIVFGVGIGNALEGIQYYDTITPRVHNFFVQILVETGILGVVLFFIFLIKSIKPFLKFKNIKYNLMLFLLIIQSLILCIFKADWGLFLLFLYLTSHIFNIINVKRSI